MNDIEFNNLVKNVITKNRTSSFLDDSKNWHDKSREHSYQYLFEWCGRPIIQDPQDVLAINKIIWDLNPDVIIETGVARGGSIMLSLGTMSTLKKFYELEKDWLVIGVDLNLEEDTRKILENCGFKSNLKLISGSSTDDRIVGDVALLLEHYETKLFVLDSNHTHEHVYQELVIFAPLTRPGDTILVLDTGIEFLPPYQDTHKLWRKGSNPFTAIQKFLSIEDNSEKFEVDDTHYYRNGLTCFRGGHLKRIAP
jgi:cephalosporin hydroxylase